MKYTKKQIKEMIDSLYKSVLSDCEMTEMTFLSNEVYSSHSNDYIKLNEGGRALLLEKQINEDFITRKLVEILDNI